MAVSNKDLKDYLRLSPEENEESLEIYLNAARAKAAAAGIPEFQNNAMYDLFILSLAAMYYDHRGMAFSGSYQATAETNAQAMINSFVLELRYAAEEKGSESE